MESELSIGGRLPPGDHRTSPPESASSMERRSPNDPKGSRPQLSKDRTRAAGKTTITFESQSDTLHIDISDRSADNDEVSSDSVLEAFARPPTKRKEEEAQLMGEAAQLTAVLMRRAGCDSEEMRQILQKKADGTLSRGFDNPEALLAGIRRYMMVESPVEAEWHSRLCVYYQLKVQRTKSNAEAQREALNSKVHGWLHQCDNPYSGADRSSIHSGSIIYIVKAMDK